MYNDYFGFTENPFSIAPDPRYLYMSELHQEGLSWLNSGLTSEGSIILLTGEVGTGKTTLCRFFLERLDPTAKVALIINPGLSSFELLTTICDEFMVRVGETAFTTNHYIDALTDFLVEAHSDDNQALLVIDEAQNLDKEALEIIRLLTSIEANQKKLLKIYLLGQSELSKMLTSPDLAQVNDCVTGRFHLNALRSEETAEYIAHRLKVAGSANNLFQSRALKRIHQLTGGIPRLINNLCDRALIGAYSINEQSIDETIVKKAALEIFGFDHTSKTIEVPVKSLVAGSLTILAIIFIWVGTTSDVFHLNLSAILPPPQHSTQISAPSREEVSVEDTEARADRSGAESADAPSRESLADQQTQIELPPVAGEDTQEKSPLVADNDRETADQKESPDGSSNIVIAPVEVSDKQTSKPQTRIIINSIKITD